MGENPTSAISNSLPPRANLAFLRKEAKRRLKALRQVEPSARLATAQLQLARAYGFASWRRLAAHLNQLLPNVWGDKLSRALDTAYSRKDLEAAEAAIRAEMMLYPEDDDLLSELGYFLLVERNDRDGAEAICRQLLARPGAVGAIHYAHFMASLDEQPHEEIEAVYRGAVETAADQPVYLGIALNNYAAFLEHRCQDIAGAMDLRRRAAEIDTGYPRINAQHQGVYAECLWGMGETEEAGRYFRKAMASGLAPNEVALSFAHMLTLTGKSEEGLALLPQILKSPTRLRFAEGMARLCWFLRYAHGDTKEQALAWAWLRGSLRAGEVAATLPLDLGRNVERVRRMHPSPRRLSALADLLMQEEPLREEQISQLLP